jgi:hypothetical protein
MQHPPVFKQLASGVFASYSKSAAELPCIHHPALQQNAARIPWPIQNPNFPRVNSTSFFVAVQHNISNWFTTITGIGVLMVGVIGSRFCRAQGKIARNCRLRMSYHFLRLTCVATFCALPTSGDIFVRRGRGR